MTKSTDPGRDEAARRSRGEKPSTGQERPAHDENKRREAEDAKATRFDGNPNPAGAERSAFKPKDDTPPVLDKKSGPRTGRA